jgi:hypothetical protein
MTPETALSAVVAVAIGRKGAGGTQTLDRVTAIGSRPRMGEPQRWTAFLCGSAENPILARG